jgi:nucleotidyltransferase substrate binding protein (TIGR01987 family)
MLDLTSLENAIKQLKESLEFAGSQMAKENPALARQFRAASIQAFEITYELTHKILKRFLETTDASPDTIDKMSFQDLIRTGAEKGLLLNSWDQWRNYRQSRNNTSHTYDEQMAETVFSDIPAFLKEAEFLLSEIQERQNSQ